MRHTGVFIALFVLGPLSGAAALTGIGDSATGPLETVPPEVDSVAAATASSLTVVFSEPMLEPGVTTAGNYTVSGLGAGTLNTVPAGVTGDGPYLLFWEAGEMRDGETVAVMVSGLRDAVGNPMNPAGGHGTCTGAGIAPEFNDLGVLPPQTSAGATVTLTFTVSEPLDGDPLVTINGHEATRAGKGETLDYIYEYEVSEMDLPGIAAIAISGFDLAGNFGALDDKAALEILEQTAGSSGAVWPLVYIFAVAGAFVLLRRRHHVASLLFFAILLAAPRAFAQAPVVSNVTFSQGPNGASGTQVDVYYDLETPNGPCDVLLSLSKDGGADGFVHPIVSYTGDIADVSSGAGRHVVWDIAADYPLESIPEARIRVAADSDPVRHTLTYTAGAKGSISGDSPQTVDHGDSGTAVLAVADFGYHFVQWSDGVLTAARQDTNVTTDLSVVACFAINTYTLTYIAGVHGAILGITPQTVNHGDGGTAVSAMADFGYHFVQWSDGVLSATRQDTNVIGDINVTAIFAINTYTLMYVAGANGAISGVTPQTVNHGGSGTPVSAVAEPGYHFVQWSDGVLTAARQDTNVTADLSVTAGFTINVPPEVISFAINAGAASTQNPAVTLDNAATENPTEFLASEAVDFSGASWQPYDIIPLFRLSAGVGVRTVYFKARNVFGESSAVSDTIFLAPEMAAVAPGTFMMGRTELDDDAAYGEINEIPRHAVTLSAYEIGKYEVTNQEYCDVLNWALVQGRLYSNSSGAAWAGSGDIYAGGATGTRYLAVAFSQPECNIQYSDGVFSPKTRTGLPGTTEYSMASHPMVRVSWYGAAAFCNWLSEMACLPLCYDMGTTNWPLISPPPTAGGYRLPTEAEWERAAAWEDAADRHWIYGMMSNTLTGSARCNYLSDSVPVNPLGLTSTPRTSPVGWFNGVNVSPKGSVMTVDSPSPAGCYDMSGNVREWCYDRFSTGYYSGGGDMTNPIGPAIGPSRVFRGGSWSTPARYCRTAYRLSETPSYTGEIVGFRLVR